MLGEVDILLLHPLKSHFCALFCHQKARIYFPHIFRVSCFCMRSLTKALVEILDCFMFLIGHLTVTLISANFLLPIFCCCCKIEPYSSMYCITRTSFTGSRHFSYLPKKLRLCLPRSYSHMSYHAWNLVPIKRRCLL